MPRHVEADVERVAATLDDAIRNWNAVPNVLHVRRTIAAQGLGLLDLDPQIGGAGHGPVAAVLVHFVCGYADCDLRDVAHAGHGTAILLWGAPSVRAEWSQRLQAGQLVGIAATERGGSSLRNVRATIRRHGDELRVRGGKRFVSRLHDADAFVVFGLLDGQPAAVIVEGDAPGLTRTDRQPLGLAGWTWGDLRFEDVRVPAQHLLTRDGRALFEAHFAFYRPMVAALCLGAAAKVLDSVADSLHDRVTAREIRTIRATAAERAGAAYAQILAGFALTLRAATSPYGHTETVLLARAAKAYAVQTAHDTLEDVALLLGATGFEFGHPVAKARRDVSAFLFADGMHDALLRSVGRSVLGVERPSDEAR